MRHHPHPQRTHLDERQRLQHGQRLLLARQRLEARQLLLPLLASLVQVPADEVLLLLWMRWVLLVLQLLLQLLLQRLCCSSAARSACHRRQHAPRGGAWTAAARDGRHHSIQQALAGLL
jgi:hypothetical protein